jgi:glycerophosphoryl diester phosphodiesterase
MTLIIAHRGASGYKPEMTIPAYELALKQNVDGFETDVRLTKDLELVGVHDRKTDRVADRDLVVSKSTLKELQELDFSSKETKAKVMTIREFLTLAIDSGKSLSLTIETKHITKHHGLLESKLNELLTEFKLNANQHERVKIVLMSFNPLAVLRFSKLNPLIPRVQLKEKSYPFLHLYPNPGNPEIVGPGIELLLKRPDLITKFKDQGKKIFVWTVNSPQDMRFCLERGIDAIITNYPDIAYLEREAFLRSK